MEWGAALIDSDTRKGVYLSARAGNFNFAIMGIINPIYRCSGD